jgi:hypothetical protein
MFEQLAPQSRSGSTPDSASRVPEIDESSPNSPTSPIPADQPISQTQPGTEGASGFGSGAGSPPEEGDILPPEGDFSADPRPERYSFQGDYWDRLLLAEFGTEGGGTYFEADELDWPPRSSRSTKPRSAWLADLEAALGAMRLAVKRATDYHGYTRDLSERIALLCKARACELGGDSEGADRLLRQALNGSIGDE